MLALSATRENALQPVVPVLVIVRLGIACLPLGLVAGRVRATEEWEREQAELQLVRDAEDLVIATVSLVGRRPDRLQVGDCDWLKLVAAMVGFVVTDAVERHQPPDVASGPMYPFR